MAEKAKPGRTWGIDSVRSFRVSNRYMAIRQLRRVYSRAAKAMVIDKNMTQCQSGEPAEKVLWSIASSSWMQRLWTYQEAFLPEHIDILFEDSLFPLEPSELPRPGLPSFIQVVWGNLFGHVASVRPNQTQQLSHKTNLGEVLAAMNGRTTSRRSHETLAAAALLDIYPWTLPENEEDGERRMEVLLLLVRCMPDEIIFFAGPKMKRQPFRWAPSTLMAHSYTMVDSSNDYHRASCTPKGLLPQQCYLLFADVQTGRDDEDYWIRDPSTTATYCLYWDPESRNDPGEINAIIMRPIEDDQYLQPEINQVLQGVVVLIDTEEDDAGNVSNPRTLGE